MNVIEMRANKDALREETPTAATKDSKLGLIQTQNLMSVFSKTITDRAKRFSPMKTTFQEEKIE